ncbi:MAG: cytochrome c [Gemmatales bacterium]|nr:cytochrome c [Gemmatales bacterium]MDW8175261.1 cytochrome c [Gemmatales bacterium]
MQPTAQERLPTQAARRWALRSIAVIMLSLLLLSAGAAWWFWRTAASPGSAPATLDTPLDVLLGQNRRAQFEAKLAQRRYGSRTWNWQDYVQWGRELVHWAQVKNPPLGPAPSVPLAETYRCIHCHNLVREDVILTQQDPEAREQMLEDNPALAGKKTGVRLMTGTTFWGMVNRERFYNGYYARYHRLKVRDGGQFRPMNPESLADAVQVCCSYCSAGRFPEDWELDSILAYLWTLELRLRDLDLPPPTQLRLLEQLNSSHPDTVAAARQELRKHYLLASAAHAVEPPLRSDDAKDIYPPSVAELERLFPPRSDSSDPPTSKPASKPRPLGSLHTNLIHTGDPKRGEWLYKSACAMCHGNEVHPKSGRALAISPGTFHRYVWKGTQRDGLYMPFFTRERLSPRQATDIRAYLRSLPANQTD